MRTDSALTLAFSEPMDRRSVESALRLIPETSGSFAWTSDTEVTFSPDGLVPGQRYVVSFASGAQSVAGLPLSGNPEYAFQALSPLLVTRTTPPDGAVEVRADAPILIEFNRPVAPLNCVTGSAFPDERCPALPLSFDPPVSGDGSWVGTSAYRFVPSVGLQAGLRYAVALADDVETTDGARLTLTHEWTFETATPRVIDVSPAPGARGVRLETGLQVRFSTPMDRTSTGGAFSLTAPDGESVPGSVTWQDGGTTLVFTPTVPLDLGIAYTAAVGPAARAMTSAPVEQRYAWTFSTVPYPSLIRHTPAADAQAVDVLEPVRLTFSGYVDADKLAESIRISPAPPASSLYSWYDASAGVFTLSWAREPRTEVCIGFDPGLTDVYGNPVSGAEDFCFATGDLAPMLTLASTVDAITLDSKLPATVQLVNRNVGTARFRLARIDLPQFVAGSPVAGDVVREWTASFETLPNATQAVTVSLDGQGRALDTGLYALSWQLIGVDALEDTALQSGVRIAVVDRHVLVKLASEEALVWVTELSGGTPVTRTAVQLLDREALLLAGGTTDNDGLIKLPIAKRSELWEPVVAVTGEAGEAGYGIAISTWQGTVFPWDFGIDFHSTAQPAYRAYFEVDRTAYRPGDTAHYSGVLRRDRSGSYELPEPGSTVNLSLHGPSGETVYEAVSQVSANGVFSGVLTIPRDGALGDYMVHVSAQPAEAGEPAVEVVAYAGFVVAAYHKPSYEVVVTPDAERAIYGEPVRFAVEARYFAGGYVARGNVEWSLYALPYDPGIDPSFARWAMEGWQWGAQRRSYGRILVAQGSGETSTNGRHTIAIGPEVAKDTALAGQSRIWELEVAVTDGNGLPIAGTASMVLHPADILLALRPRSWVIDTGDRSDLHLAAADWTGKGLEGVDLRLMVYRRNWANPLLGSSGAYTDTLVVEQNVTTDRNGEATVSLRLSQAGEYVATVIAADPEGREVSAGATLMVGSGQGSILSQHAGDRLELAVDAPGYAIGDSARVLIPVSVDGPYQLLVTVEREGILWTHTETLDRPNPVIEIPIVAEFAPSAYVSCLVVVPAEVGGAFSALAGYATLNVETASQRLGVRILSDRDAYSPGEEALLTFTVTDADGVPQVADVTVSVVDAAAPGLAAHELTAAGATTLVQAFYSPRPLRVLTGDGLLVAMDQTPLPSAEAEALADGYLGAPRGMGGGAESAVAGPQPRTDFPDTALYRAAIPTGTDGTAELRLTLPDSLTLWEIRAWAVTQDTKVGQATDALLVTKPLSIEPLTPQFLVAGDSAELAAVVRNNTSATVRVQVQLDTAEALRITSPRILEFPVGPDERQRVAWAVTALPTLGGTEGSLSFSARSGDLADASTVTLPALADGLFPIRGLTTRESVGAAGALDSMESRTEIVMLPEDVGAQSEAVLRVDTSLTSVILSEPGPVRTRSVAWSTDNWVSELQAVTAARIVRGGGIGNDLAQIGDPTSMDVLEQLYQRQNPDGGWGWRDRVSNLHLTTYVVHGLVEAQKTGLTVRSSALDSGVAYIRDWVARGIEAGLRQSHLAFSLHVLAEAQQSWPQGAGTALYADRDKMGIAGRAYLALAFGALDRSDTRLSSLLQELRSAVIVSGSGAHWEDANAQTWSTSVQSTALALKVLVRYAPDDPLLPDVVRWLVASRGNRGSVTPYESAWVVSALAEYASASGELNADYNWQVALNGATVLEALAGERDGAALVFSLSAPANQALRRGLNVVDIARSAGSGRLYYTLRMHTVRPVDLANKGERRGIALNRQYCLATEEPSSALLAPTSGACLPIDSVRVGDLVEVRLTVVIPEARHYLKVEDPFPAGLAPDALALTDSRVGSDSPVATIAGVDPTDGAAVGALGLPDLLDDRALFSTEHLPAGTYRASYYLRATTPGRFHALPAIAEEVYFPEIWASTPIDVLEIVPQD